MTTRKRTGGDISASKAFQNIISIGYELETSDITKFTLMDDPYGEKGKVFLNTDTARKDIKKIKFGVEEDDPDYADMVARADELLDLDFYDNNNKIDKHTSFLVTNDISKRKLNQVLEDYCEDKEEEDEEDDEDEVKDLEESEQAKNELYEIRVRKQSFPVTFIYGEPKGCSVFSNVEWVITYYDPNKYKSGNKNKNIILETFFNVAKNLLKHVNELQPQPANLILKHPTSTGEYVKNGVLTKPINRILYNLPKTNMCYFQTHVSNQNNKTFDDVFLTIQMTFACKIQHVYGILRALSSTKLLGDYGLEDANKYNEIIERILIKLKKCVDELFKNSKLDLDELSREKAKSLVFLILWKIYIYYNRWYKKPHEDTYFKNNIVFNIRHSSYELYKELKKIISSEIGLSDEETAHAIQKLIVNEEILSKYMITETTPKLHKMVFKTNMVCDTKSKTYGDPAISLYCYLKFFEHPSELEDNIKTDDKSHVSSEMEEEDMEEELEEELEEDMEGGNKGGQPNLEFYNYDWFEYASIDVFSTHMEYKDDIVLIELRHFPTLLGSYLYSISDPELQESMKINRDGMVSKTIRSISVGNLRKVLEIYRRKKMRSMSSTRKRSSVSK